ncbi:DUF1902 domain-containing protein [Nisaea sp.]|uniref:DUF1902 domain-containing protein n=1 Tax=Nisaea sp. TaxID=2024842 RepID=UPI0032EFEAD3
MKPSAINVRAVWDDEAQVWSVSSEDVVGLAIEAATREEVERKLDEVLPELIELNHPEWLEMPDGLPLHIMTERTSHLRLSRA